MNRIQAAADAVGVIALFQLINELFKFRSPGDHQSFRIFELCGFILCILDVLIQYL